MPGTGRQVLVFAIERLPRKTIFLHAPKLSLSPRPPTNRCGWASLTLSMQRCFPGFERAAPRDRARALGRALGRRPVGRTESDTQGTFSASPGRNIYELDQQLDRLCQVPKVTAIPPRLGVNQVRVLPERPAPELRVHAEAAGGRRGGVQGRRRSFLSQGCGWRDGGSGERQSRWRGISAPLLSSLRALREPPFSKPAGGRKAHAPSASLSSAPPPEGEDFRRLIPPPAPSLPAPVPAATVPAARHQERPEW